MKTERLTFLVFALLLPAALLANGSITGRITAKDDGSGLAGATVTIQGLARGTTANADGTYRISNVPDGAYSIIFSIV